MASGSKSSTSTSTSSNTQVSEVNLQDTGGITAQGNSGNVTVYSTDQGTVAAAGNAVNAALGAATKVTGQAIQANTDVSSAAIQLGSQALTEGNSIATAGLDNAEAAYQSGLTFGTTALNTVQQLTDQYAAEQSSLVQTALDGYQSIAQQNSASTNTQIQKIALWAIAAAVLMVLVSGGRIKL